MMSKYVHESLCCCVILFDSNNDFFVCVCLQALLVYISGVLANSGNYKGFGDSKIIPNLPKDRLEKIILSSAAHKADPKTVEALWKACGDNMYSLDHLHQHLGFSDKGTTTYFTPNCTLKDSELVGNFMKKYNLEGYNNRLFKYEDGSQTTYEVQLSLCNSFYSSNI